MTWTTTPNQKKLGRYVKLKLKLKTVICKFSLTCITLKTIQQHFIWCFTWWIWLFFLNKHLQFLPFLFTTLKMFRDWKHKVMKPFRCNFVPFFLQTTLKVCNGTGSSLSHFAFQNVPHILYWGQVRTAGRPVQHLHTLLPQPCLWNVCRMWFCIVLFKYAWASLENMSSWRQH